MLRLLGKLFRPGPDTAVVDAVDVGVDASGFSGNLTEEDDTVQKVAERVDAITAGSQTGPGGADEVARNAAAAAARGVATNKGLIDALEKVSIGRIDVNPNRIEDVADLDGTYQCILSLTDAELNQLNTAGVNELEIWFGTETVHTVSPWVPSLVTRIDAIVDTSEETQIGAVNRALVVRSVYRISGTFYAEGAGALRIGGYSEYAAGDDLQSITVGSLGNYNAAVAAQVDSDQPLELVFATSIVLNAGTAREERYDIGDVIYFAPYNNLPERRFNIVTHTELEEESKGREQGDELIEYGGISTADELTAALTTHSRADANHVGLLVIDMDFTTATRSYAAGQRWHIAPHHTGEGEMVLLDAGGSLTKAQQIALLALIPEPSSITYTGSDDLAGKVKTIRVNIANPELLTGDVWVLGYTQGQPAIGGRTKWASNTPGLDIVLADANADAVASALVTDSESQVEVRLRFYDAANAGNEIERLGFNIPLVDQRKIPTLEAGFKALGDRSTALEKRSPTALVALPFNANLAIDFEDGAMRAVTLTGNTTVAIANFSPGDVLVLQVTQDATGGRGITWPASVEWPGGSAEGPSSGANEVDLFTLLALANNRIVASALLDIS